MPQYTAAQLRKVWKPVISAYVLVNRVLIGKVETSTC